MMELCGSNVRELKKATSIDRFSLSTSLWILKKMVQAVEFMHRNGWIHRLIFDIFICILNMECSYFFIKFIGTRNFTIY